jgi:hypothetical protein
MRLSEPNGQNSAREMHLGLSPSSIQTPSVGRAASLPRENLGPSAVRRHATALDPIASKNPNNSKQLVRRRRDSNRAVLLSNFYISNGLPTSVPTNWGSVARTASCLGDRRTPLATSDGEHPATQTSAVKTLSIAADVGIAEEADVAPCYLQASRGRHRRVGSCVSNWCRTLGERSISELTSPAGSTQTDAELPRLQPSLSGPTYCRSSSIAAAVVFAVGDPS